MIFTSKFTDETLMSIYEIILDYSSGDSGTLQLTTSGSDMAEILEYSGYVVSVAFVQRARQKLGIKARGSCSCKFNSDELKAIQKLICEYALLDKESWKLTVSDANMSQVLNERGFTVNSKYVERTRRSLGIEPLGERGGARPGAGRPSMSSLAQDPILMSLHESAVIQLSYHRTPSGALLGQTGSDVHDRFGYHTVDLDDAIEKKNKELFRSGRKKVPTGFYVNEQVPDAGIEIASVIDDEINSKNTYGKTGKGGGVSNTRAAQAYSSF